MSAGGGGGLEGRDLIAADEASLLLRELRGLARRRKRRSLDEIWRVFRGQIRGYTAESEARAKAGALLEQLERRGVVRLPRGAKSWDDAAVPALPKWIQLADWREAPDRLDHRAVAWPPELAFVTSLNYVSALDDLLAIKRFLANGGRERPSVPLRERSVELFGDEKRLDQLVTSALFGPGRLDLSMLRCHDVAPALVFEVGPREAPASLLIIENLHTYESVRTLNAQRARYRLVAYGQGNSFSKTAADLPRLREHFAIDAVGYFGDLDLEGLRIVQRANALLTDLEVDFAIESAATLYDLLIARRDDYRQSLDAEARSVEVALTDWLPETVREPARAILERGHRLPQELVGFETLTKVSGW